MLVPDRRRDLDAALTEMDPALEYIDEMEAGVPRRDVLHAQALQYRGWLLHKKGDDAEAAAVTEQAIALTCDPRPTPGSS